MAEHTIPADHKGLLQAILKWTIQAQDPDATFVEAEPEPEPEPKPRTGFE